MDQLVGSFGPALEVYSRYAEVRTDTGEEVGVDRAIDIASDAVSNWRIQQLAARGLPGVEAEGRFALLCWDVLGAAEFRFNEAKLLGHAVGMDVAQLVAAGLVTRKLRQDQHSCPPRTAAGARRSRMPKTPGKAARCTRMTWHSARRSTAAMRSRSDTSKPAAAAAGIGAARSLARQQGWDKDSPVARLMAALVQAAPPAVRIERGKQSAAAKFPEFRAWHALLFPLFGFPAPDWTEKLPRSDGVRARAPRRQRRGERSSDGEASEEDEEEDAEEERVDGAPRPNVAALF